jgi:hypothetical protein
MSFMGRIDGDSVRRNQELGEASEIDHGASAKENLKEVGRDVKKIFTADKVRELVRASNEAGILGFALLAIGAPYAVAGDVLDPFVQPGIAVKDAADAAVHGIVHAFKGIVP